MRCVYLETSESLLPFPSNATDHVNGIIRVYTASMCVYEFAMYMAANGGDFATECGLPLILRGRFNLPRG